MHPAAPNSSQKSAVSNSFISVFCRNFAIGFNALHLGRAGFTLPRGPFHTCPGFSPVTSCSHSRSRSCPRARSAAAPAVPRWGSAEGPSTEPRLEEPLLPEPGTEVGSGGERGRGSGLALGALGVGSAGQRCQSSVLLLAVLCTLERGRKARKKHRALDRDVQKYVWSGSLRQNVELKE